MAGVRGLTEGRKKERKRQPPSELLLLHTDFCSVFMFINLPCPGRLFISALKCLLQHSAGVQGAISFVKNKNIIYQRKWTWSLQREGRSDHLMNLLPCSHPADTGSVTWDQACGQKRRVKADRQGNPFSFFWIQRLSDYRLLTTHASCWVEGTCRTETALLFAFWSFIPSSVCLFHMSCLN